ncbi:MAG: formylglycine-generating enzyme family protein, partial [Armatimonadetes bacterium]|nr:formylglycine-generating enzyme family protein [Armatimonadota bacterium]
METAGARKVPAGAGSADGTRVEWMPARIRDSNTATPIREICSRCMENTSESPSSSLSPEGPRAAGSNAGAVHSGMTSAWRGRFILLAACLVLAACIARGTRPEAPRPPSGLQFIGRNSRGFGEYVNPQDGSVLVRIPAGPFIMGSQARDEGPRHRVYLPAFFMARCEVTNVQFATFTRATGYRATSDWQTCAARSGDLAPVTMVSWWDAVEYCRWAG